MKNLLTYYRYLKLCRTRYILAIVAGILNGMASGLGMPFIAFKLLPMAIPDATRNDAALIGVVLLVPLIAAVRGATLFSTTYLMGYCDNLITMEMRKDLMRHMQKLSLAFFHKSRTGQIMSRVLNDTSKISSVITQGTADLVRQPVTIIGAFLWIGYLAYKSRELFILVLVITILPACIFLIRSIGKKIAKRETQMGQNEGSLNTIVHENIESARETRAFNLHKREEAHFANKAKKQFKIQMRLLSYKTLISPSIELITSFGVAAAILYATFKDVPISALGPLLMALYVCYEPVKKLGVAYTAMQRATTAANRTNESILKSTEYLERAESPIPCHPFARAIKFDGVTFSYGKKSRALHRLSVSINRGDVVALIGPSGSGKSTFCNLICRFYDPKRGTVTYDGTDIRQFDENDYRSHIAIVPQDSFLFADTIMNNIRIGRLDASDEEVIEAARKANAHEFIEDQPDGYGTLLAERGVSLSGGQRQRIAIARAFLRDSEILILDEATSAIDAKSEEKIHAALARLFENKTVIIIAHRYSTIRLAKRLLLFKDGQIEMDGTEEDLEAGSDFFRSLKVSGIEPGLIIPDESTDSTDSPEQMED